MAAAAVLLQGGRDGMAWAADASTPSLSPMEIGHIRQFAKLAYQLPGDWSEMGDGAMGWLGVPERTFRYQLANMAYAIAAVQYERTPAYREFYRETLQALFNRLLEPDCWREWASVSRGGGHSDPTQPGLGPGEFDPIRRHNIMYGGHVLHVAGLYEMLYAEGRYTKPGSIRLEWVERNWGPGPQVFEYDIQKIVDLFVKQLEELNFEGFPCEPNLTFPECPQHAVLGIMLADTVLGTKHSMRVRERYLESFQRLGFVDPKTKSFTYAYQRRQKQMLSGAPMAWADGWTGAFMHAWAPEFIEALYPTQRDRLIPAFFDRRLRGLPEAAPEATAGMGYFAVYAAELGDVDTVRAILEFADRNLAPVWNGGRYYYPRCDDAAVDERGVVRMNSALQGNALLPFGRLLRGRGLWRLHNQPWTAARRAEPEVTGVDYLAAGVSAAWYDAAHETLHVGFRPGPLRIPQTRFSVQRLDPRAACRVVCDEGRSVSLSPGQSAEGMARAADGSLEVAFDPRRTTSFVIAVDRSRQNSSVGG